jgi:5-oxoprolinase (ATP-hydrolysing) subunit A
MKSIDLNCDMGESFGPWKMGQDEAVMPLITSANIACGAHAGDPDVMAMSVKLARQYNVAVGAHPGYPDLRWFGRRPMRLTPDEIVNLILTQVGALWAIARSQGAELTHVKPHGALYNQACADRQLAKPVVHAVGSFSRHLYLMGLPASELEAEAHDRGLPFLAEGFLDRAYEPNGSLRDRYLPGAVLTDPAHAAAQAQDLARGTVKAHDGTTIRVDVQTLCIHGDSPGAAEFAGVARRALKEAGFKISAPESVEQ